MTTWEEINALDLDALNVECAKVIYPNLRVYKVDTVYWQVRGNKYTIPIQNYSGDIAAAWELFKWLNERTFCPLIISEFNPGHMRFDVWINEGQTIQVRCDSIDALPAVICRVFLAVQGAKR